LHLCGHAAMWPCVAMQALPPHFTPYAPLSPHPPYPLYSAFASQPAIGLTCHVSAPNLVGIPGNLEGDNAPTGSHRNTWRSIGIPGNLEGDNAPTGSHRSTDKTSLRLIGRFGGRGGGFNWIHSVSLGFTWSHLDSLDLTWIRLVSNGIT